MAAQTDTVTYDSLLTTTLNNTRATIYDNIFRDSAFFARLHANDRKRLQNGGARIQRSTEYATNGTIASYNGYDPIDLTPQDPLTVALEDWKEIAGSVVISRREERINSGAAQIADMLEAKISNLSMSFREKLNEMLLAPNGASQTPGNGGKDINNLSKLVSKAATTVHGINESNESWWANQRKSSASTNGTSLTLDLFVAECNNAYNLGSKGTGGRPDLALTTLEVYEKYEEALRGKVRYGSTESANMGFETIKLKGADLVWDEISTRQANNDGDILNFDDGSADEHIMYLLNTNFLWLIVDSQTDLVNRPFMTSQDQTAKSALVLFMGNTMVTNRRKQVFFSGISTGDISG